MFTTAVDKLLSQFFALSAEERSCILEVLVDSQPINNSDSKNFILQDLNFFHETLFGKGYKVVVNDVVVEILSGNPSKPDICHCLEGGVVIINQLDIEDSFLVFL